jgi:hypothetical protein
VSQMERDLDFLAFLEGVEASITQLVANLRGLTVNDVLDTRLSVFNSNGHVRRDYRDRFGSVAVANLTTSTVVVHAAPPGDAAPAGGVGVGRLPAGHAATFNLTGNVLTLYGPVGGKVNLTVFTKPQPPSWGGPIIGASS